MTHLILCLAAVAHRITGLAAVTHVIPCLATVTNLTMSENMRMPDESKKLQINLVTNHLLNVYLHRFDIFINPVDTLVSLIWNCIFLVFFHVKSFY